MYVKQEHAERLFEKTSQSFAKKGVHNFTDLGFVDAFEEQLRVMARARKYQEGEQIMPGDLVLLKETVQTILTDMKEGMLDQRETLEQSENQTGKLSVKEKGAYDTLLAMTEVTDHLYAMAMKTLGCPNIPASFGTDIVDMIGKLSSEAELEMKEKEYKKTDVDRRYREQRGKNAAEVRKAISTNKTFIRDKKESPLRVAQYAADYHALKKRQEGHGAVWRFFHKKENEARTKLLEMMKKDLVALAGADADVDAMTPVEISVAYNQAKAKEALSENGIAKRAQMPKEDFAHEPTLTDRAENDKENPHKGMVYDEANRWALTFPEGLFEKNEKGEKEINLSEYEVKKVPLPQTKSQL